MRQTMAAAQQQGGGGGGGVMASATEWWHAGDYSGTTATGQKGSVDLTANSSLTTEDDGTYNFLTLEGTSHLDGGTGNFEAVGDFSIVHVCKFTEIGGTRIVCTNRSGGDDGYTFYTSGTTPSFIIDGGTPTTETGGAVTTATLYTFGFGRDGSTQWLEHPVGTVNSKTCTSADISNTSEFRINNGVGFGDPFPADQEWIGTAVFIGVVLSGTEVEEVSDAILAAAAI